METKKCSKCGEEKELSEFYNDKHSKDGKHSQCKVCKNNAKMERYYSDIEKSRQYLKEQYSKHRETRMIYRAKYMKENREALAKRSRDYYANNKDKVKKKNAERYKRNIDTWKKINKERHDRYYETLHDSYIRTCITSRKDIHYSEVTHELIKNKRKELIVTRLLNNLKSAANEQ